MTTGYVTLDITLLLILIAATIWYVYTIVDELRKNTYWLTVPGEDKDTYIVIETYKEKNMQEAVINHLISYDCDLALLRFKSKTDYNEDAMQYTLDLNGETYEFVMMKEREDISFE